MDRVVQTGVMHQPMVLTEFNFSPPSIQSLDNRSSSDALVMCFAPARVKRCQDETQPFICVQPSTAFNHKEVLCSALETVPFLAYRLRKPRYSILPVAKCKCETSKPKRHCLVASLPSLAGLGLPVSSFFTDFSFSAAEAGSLRPSASPGVSGF